LIIRGTTGNSEIILWGLPLHIRLAKAIGLIVLLGSISTALVMYGGSLPPTRSELERREGRANDGSGQETQRAQEKGTWNKKGREAQSTPSRSAWRRKQARADAASLP
jgi:hypothetical protein